MVVAGSHDAEPAVVFAASQLGQVSGFVDEGQGQAGGILQAHLQAQPGGVFRDPEKRADGRDGIVVQALFRPPAGPGGGQVGIQPVSQLPVEIEFVERRDGRRLGRDLGVDQVVPRLCLAVEGSGALDNALDVCSQFHQGRSRFSAAHLCADREDETPAQGANGGASPRRR